MAFGNDVWCLSDKITMTYRTCYNLGAYQVSFLPLEGQGPSATYNNNTIWGLTSQKHDMIMKDAVVEGSGNFDHLGFFSVHLNLSTRASDISQLPRSGPLILSFSVNTRQIENFDTL